MKKIIALVQCICMCLFLAACCGNPNPGATTPTIVTDETSPTIPGWVERAYRPDSPAEYIGDIILNLEGDVRVFENPDGSGTSSLLEAGKTYIVIGFAFEESDTNDQSWQDEFWFNPRFNSSTGKVFICEIIPVQDFSSLGAAVHLPVNFKGIVVYIADMDGVPLGYVDLSRKDFIPVT